jgi:TolB protein
LTEFANPYRPGEPVADPALLFGRQNAADWLELQVAGGARSLVVSGLPFIGKTSFIRHVGVLQNLKAIHILVELSEPALPVEVGRPARRDERPQTGINEVLQAVIEQILPQLEQQGLLPNSLDGAPEQPTTLLRYLLVQANQGLRDRKLLLYFDDLQHLLTGDKTLVSAFLTALLPWLDECPTLHVVFTVNQDKLKLISHPMLDGAPAFNLGPLSADGTLNLITAPVKNMLRFDYGVTKRIAEINSHHPFYLTLFCSTLLNRQIHDGWVNQRDFDAAVAEILESPIEPFRQIWNESTWAERAVLAGIAAIQGAHGPMTRQEVTRFLQRQSNAVVPEVIFNALESLAARGVLASMGAVSYRFHVELLRFWLREHTNPAEILAEVDWGKSAAQLRSVAKGDKATLPAIGSAAPATSRPKRRLWPLLVSLLLLACGLTTGGVFAAQYLNLPFPFLLTPTVTPTATPPAGEIVIEATVPTPTLPPQPTATPSPTPALVMARTLPALTYMARDVDQNWRIYVMNADGSGVSALSGEGADNTAPVWSPNGQQIAFVSQRDGNRDIYIVPADCVTLPEGCDQSAVNVTRHPADDWTPAWSPDGTRLAFSSIRAGNWEIFVVEVACMANSESCPDQTTQLTADGNGNILPVYSPDAGRIAFSSKASGNWDIYTMTSQGSDLRQITTDPANDLSPAWSPNGQQLAFETNRDGNVEVYVMAADGSAARNISNFSQANDHGPTWSPDGQLLVFYANREGNWDIFSATLADETTLNLTNTPTRDEQTPAWRP